LSGFAIIIYFITTKSKIKLFRNEQYILFLLSIIAVIGLTSNISSYFKGYRTNGVAIIGDFINFYKAFVVYFAIRLLSNNFDSKKVITKLRVFLKYIFLILIGFIIVDFIFKIFPHPIRYEIYSYELFFKHPSRFAFAFAFIFIALFPKYYLKNKGFLLAVLICGLLSLRVKYFGFVVISIFFMFYGKKLFKISKIYFFTILGILSSLIVWFFWYSFELYFSFDKIEDAWSRAVILYYSFFIGNDFFPLGTGFGTYSSYFSGKYYSWVYDLYSIDEVWGISRIYWGFIADQYWPMVLGQFGYLGLFSMLLVIYNFFLLFIKRITDNINDEKYFNLLSVVLGLVLLIIDSTSDAILTQQRAVVMFIYFALIINSTKYDNKNI